MKFTKAQAMVLSATDYPQAYVEATGNGMAHTIQVERITIANADAADYIFQLRDSTTAKWYIIIPASSSIVLAEEDLPENLLFRTVVNYYVWAAVAAAIVVFATAQLNEQ